MIWRPIPGHIGYEVSDEGQVRSLPRIQRRKNGSPHPVKGKVLKQTMNPEGYFVTGVSNRKVIAVHKLVAMAFLEKPTGCARAEVDHINRIKTDNRLENLRWVRSSVNRMNTHPESNNSSGRRGVYFDKSTMPWSAAIKSNGKKIHLGSSRTLSKAIAFREAAERKFWQEFNSKEHKLQ